MRKLAAGVALCAGSALFSVGAAGAQTAEPCPESPQVCPPPDVGGEEVTPPGGGESAQPVTQPQVGGAEVEAGLPVTGTDTAVLLGAGAVLVAGGGALVARSKRATAGSH